MKNGLLIPFKFDGEYVDNKIKEDMLRCSY